MSDDTFQEDWLENELLPFSLRSTRMKPYTEKKMETSSSNSMVGERDAGTFWPKHAYFAVFKKELQPKQLQSLRRILGECAPDLWGAVLPSSRAEWHPDCYVLRHKVDSQIQLTAKIGDTNEMQDDHFQDVVQAALDSTDSVDVMKFEKDDATGEEHLPDIAPENEPEKSPPNKSKGKRLQVQGSNDSCSSFDFGGGMLKSPGGKETPTKSPKATRGTAAGGATWQQRQKQVRKQQGSEKR